MTQTPLDSADATASPRPGADAGRAPFAWLRRTGGLALRADRVIEFALLAVPIAWLAGYLFPPINHDVGAVLDVAHRWVSGERLYVDIIDVNFPLVFIVYAIPELLSRWLGGSAVLWLNGLLIAAILGSFATCRRLVHLIPSTSHPLAEALLPPVILFVLAVLPNDMFGQREHIMLIAAMPYLLLAGVRAEGGDAGFALRLGIGLAAGIGFGLKPFFLFIPLFVELYLLALRGWRRTFADIVPWAIGLLAVVHALIVFFVTPAYGEVVLPLVAELYSEVGESTWSVLTGRLVLPTLIAWACIGALAFFLARSPFARATILFAAAAMLSAILQAKGWKYHMLPSFAAVIVLASAALAQMVDRYLPIERRLHRRPAAGISAFFLALLYYQAALFNPPFYKQIEFNDSITDTLIHVVEQYAPNRRILVLSPGIYPYYPLVNYTGVRMAMRFQTMWLLQGIYAECDEEGDIYNPPERMGEQERMVFESVSDDFARLRPDLVIVDNIPGIPECGPNTFSYLAYFKRNPKFAQAFDNYDLLLNLNQFSVYRRH
ncbi:MAG: glycosyltransferase family 87 protein [Reyranellaceae bacterium]